MERLGASGMVTATMAAAFITADIMGTASVDTTAVAVMALAAEAFMEAEAASTVAEATVVSEEDTGN